MMQA
jgi:chromosome segregation ATPase